MIRLATKEDISVIISIIDEARETMVTNGNSTQWPQGYPAKSTIEDDIASGTGYVIEENGKTVAFLPSASLSISRNLDFRSVRVRMKSLPFCMRSISKCPNSSRWSSGCA